MLNITVAAESAASPERVLALAGSDFSAHRSKVWKNVKASRLQVHERGATHVEVTEHGTGPAWFAWERTRYDWSEPDRIRQTVIDSNVLEPGSTWELRVRPREGGGGGSQVEMTLARTFRHTPAGRVGSFYNHLGGRRGWRWYLRQALKAVEAS
jgi:hypothetical protein